MIFIFKQPGLALIRRNQKYIVVRSIPSLLRSRMVSPAGRRGSDLPRLILFFVAAKKNGSACYGRSGNDVRVRFYSSLPQRRMARLQTATNPRLQ